jgi:low density lipoprotein receptor-related protein 5/6
MKKLTLLLVLLGSIVSYTSYSQTQVYWGNTSSDAIFSAHIDGTNIQTLISTPFPEDVIYNPDDNMLYWVNGNAAEFAVHRMNMDGSNNTVLIPNLSSPDGLALDLCNGKIYYAESTPANISKANLDGSNIEVVVAGAAGGVEGIAIDVENENIYWVNFGGGTIMRSDFDGMNIQTVISGLGGPLKLAKDMSSGQIYFSEFTTTNVSRVGGDGTGYTVLNNTFTNPGGIALDLDNGFIYVANGVGVSRINLDGTGKVNLVAEVGANNLALAINGNANACAPEEVIPTMGEWGIISLSILFLIVGIIGI